MEQPVKKGLDLNRRPMPKQPVEVRRRNFEEVALGYDAKLAMEEASRCIQCKKPGCVEKCPVEVDIPGFIQAIAEGDFERGVRILKAKNSLPSVCGRVCPQETQCEGGCALHRKAGQIAIGRLERFLGDWEAAQPDFMLPEVAPPTGKRVAVVGGGPAGLTVAGDLVKLGHEVTIFEALHKVGGVLVYGIPEFRLPKRIVEREVEYLRRLGVKMVTNYVVGKTRTVDSLLEEYDAVFVGSGAGLPWFSEMPGNNLNGVYSANEYLTRINLMRGYTFPLAPTPVKRHVRVAVIGGGNVAMDCARTALRMGAETTILYRRSREEMPARLEEIENAEEEGVIFRYLTLPVRCIGDERGWVKGLECIRMELGEPDASGRRSPLPVPGSEFFLPFDAVIHAIGNSPNPLIPQTTPGIEIGRKGNIVADPQTGKTTKPRVWAGGDVVTGAATVILAMGAGRRAARSIHEYLTNPGEW
ncbi:MAG: NADPH-dependent glutamate synthase [Anaerolineales bacterium]|nr:NADPH-dependent glutamate synthase [Anaerolineales bacterium]MDW8161496.1 NADPH-dependent glutamate synthase [Anaerolineales bacterium]